MRTTCTLNCVIALLLCTLSTGCGIVPIGPDTEPFKTAEFYGKATVTDKAEDGTPLYYHVIKPGANTVIVSGEGTTPGRYSSAHASHRQFFFVLPAVLQEGHTYNVSQDDGSLWFSAFAGYSPRYLDRAQPAGGTVHVRKATTSTIIADIDVRCTSIYDEYNVPENDRPRKLEEWAGTFEFRRRSVPRPREE